MDENSKFHKDVTKILQDENNWLFTTTKNISEYFAVCSKLAIKEEKVFGFYNDLLENTTFLYPNESSLQYFHLLLHKYQPKGNRVYDIEIASIMLAHNLKQIITFNISDFKDIEEIEIYKL